ncbi:hypothetical protein QFZ76_000519 [Streptomyces sp. V4I2]|nr:hypothetical protein [Streptomyces sp. V4I2]
MRPNGIIEVLNRPISQELPAIGGLRTARAEKQHGHAATPATPASLSRILGLG